LNCDCGEYVAMFNLTDSSMDFAKILEAIIKLAATKGGVDKLTSEEIESIVSPQDTPPDFMEKFKSLFNRPPKQEPPKSSYTFEEMQSELKKIAETFGGEIKTLKDIIGEQANKTKSYEEEMKKRVDAENKAKIKVFLEKAVADGKLATEEGGYFEEADKKSKYQLLLEKDYDSWKTEIEARKPVVSNQKAGQQSPQTSADGKTAKPTLGMVNPNFLKYVNQQEI